MYVDHNGNFTENKPDAFEGEVDPEDILTSVPKTEDDGSKTGRVKFYNEEKKFGFIKAGGKIGDIYFSQSDNAIQLNPNDKVKFQVGEGENGPYAYDISLVQ